MLFESLYLKESVKETSVEYTQACSFHGVQYIGEAGKGLFSSKVIWSLIVFIAIGVGIFLSIDVS